MSDLSHVDEAGAVRMVDVGAKPLSRRRAVARAEVRMAPETARRLRDLPKGDALTTAQLAGVSNQMTAFAAALYFWARLGHFVVLTLGIPYARTVIWTASWVAEMIIAWQVLSH